MRISDWSSDVCSSDLLALGVRQPGAGTAVMEAVAERDHPLRRMAGYRVTETGEGGGAVVRGQQNAAACEPGALLQVQVGDDQGPACRPDQHAVGIGEQLGAVEMDENGSAHRATVRRAQVEVNSAAPPEPPRAAPCCGA